jgi:hypothetical protein
MTTYGVNAKRYKRRVKNCAMYDEFLNFFEEK